ERRELDDRRLHLGEPALELPHILEERAPSFVERGDLGRRRRQLLDACPIVLAVDGDRFELRVEHFEHGSKMRLERPRADGADSVLAQLDDLLPLLFYIAQL